MAIEKKGLGDISSGMRSAYEKAQDVMRKNNIEYAIDLLKGIVQKEPGFTDARESLRQLEKKKYASLSFFTKLIANIKCNKFLLKGKTSMKKKPLEAMKHAEDALALNLHAPGALSLLAEAAENAGANFIAIEALELVREVNPKNEVNLRWLAEIYKEEHEGIKVLQIFQQIADMKPNDNNIQSELRAAAALASMEKGRWEEKGDFKDKLKDKEESESIEQEDRIVRNIDDVNDMIGRLEKVINDGDTSIDNRRKLAELYYRAKRFDESIETYNQVSEMLGVLDPTVDRNIEKSVVGKIDQQIEELQAEGGHEEDIQALQAESYEYRLGRAEQRVRDYPNDTQLRFDLAEVYWEGGSVDKALEQFQIAQRNPQRRLEAIVYLGRCFHSKQQFDMAVEQFNKAIEGMLVMDKGKMNALYHLGITYEDMNEADKAIACFKQIYQANVNYLDIAQRMEKYYQK
jgi:tetratricopeptide (TPR) repeat protein